MSKKKPIKRWRLVFVDDEEGRNRFKVCFASIRAVFAKYAKGIDSLRTCNRLFDKFEEISSPVEDKNDQVGRSLDTGGGEVLLEANEMSTLRKMVTDDDIGWAPFISHAAEETIDWLSGNDLVAETISEGFEGEEEDA